MGVDEVESNYEIFLSTDNLIYYLSIIYFIRNRIKNIEQKELIDAMAKQLDNSNNILNQESSKSEKSTWLSLGKTYRKGDFAKQNDIFRIDFYEVLIKLELSKNSKNIEIILEYDIHVGN